MQKIFIAYMCIFLFSKVNAQKITRAEYFIDKDPGVGKGISLQIKKADTVTLQTQIKLQNIGTGTHVLYVRAANDTSWSTTESFIFNVYDSTLVSPIAKAEYFIDKDRGVGKGKKLAIGPPSDTILRTLSIPVPTNLDTSKKHFLCIRVANSSGVWSLYERDTFTVKAAAFSQLNLAAQNSNSTAFIFPNPVHDKLNIEEFITNKKIVFIHIYNEAGKLQKLFSAAAGNMMQLNIADLPEGAYFLYITDNETSAFFKFIKN